MSYDIRLVQLLNCVEKIKIVVFIHLTLINLLTLLCSLCQSTRVSKKFGAGQPEAVNLAVRVVLCLAITG
jgi:Na+-driven multidrug efflux pump